ncbi:DUF3592 domain-containing protein [Umezawaea beigongshangensis]|uniref:DUF3592 domain-containing protein n=1 Tax=Umezawaea beigongshangensis TaxID=2780383 RepID=UPI0027DE192F|nr:DUF3592 domain-containing protein [Umezawaea beigongshangensis]
MTDDAVVTSWRTPLLRRVRTGLIRALLTLGCVVTVVCVILVLACWRDDAAVEARTGRANAEVVSVAFNRTVVRFGTSDGRVFIPSQGVLYPEGLEVGQVVRVEYDTANPETTRVAGRTAVLSFLPVGTYLLAVWAVLAPLIWWLRRRARQTL